MSGQPNYVWHVIRKIRVRRVYREDLSAYDARQIDGVFRVASKRRIIPEKRGE